MTVTGITYAVGAGAFTNVGNAIALSGNVTLLSGGSVTNDQTLTRDSAARWARFTRRLLRGGANVKSMKRGCAWPLP